MKIIIKFLNLMKHKLQEQFIPKDLLNKENINTNKI